MKRDTSRVRADAPLLYARRDLSRVDTINAMSPVHWIPTRDPTLPHAWRDDARFALLNIASETAS
jgi:hypothetical protein